MEKQRCLCIYREYLGNGKATLTVYIICREHRALVKQR